MQERSSRGTILFRISLKYALNSADNAGTRRGLGALRSSFMDRSPKDFHQPSFLYRTEADPLLVFFSDFDCYHSILSCNAEQKKLNIIPMKNSFSH